MMTAIMYTLQTIERVIASIEKLDTTSIITKENDIKDWLDEAVKNGTDYVLNEIEGKEIKAKIFMGPYPSECSWNILVSYKSENPSLLRGDIFFRNTEWNLWLSEVLDSDDQKHKTINYIHEKIPNLETLKQILIKPNRIDFFQRSVLSLHDIQNKYLNDESTLELQWITSSTPNASNHTLIWLIKTALCEENDNFVLSREIDCVWQFEKKFVDDQSKSSYVQGFFIFKPDSKMDIWYCMETQHESVYWQISGNIPHMDQSEISNMATWPIERWRSSKEYVYCAKSSGSAQIKFPWIE